MTIQGYRFGQSEAGRRIEETARAYQAKMALEEARKREAEERERAAAEALAHEQMLREVAAKYDIPIENASLKVELPGDCRQIIREVSAKHGIPVHVILSRRREKALMPARWEAMYRGYTETGLSLPALGRVFHRDHTTVAYGVIRYCETTGTELPASMGNWDKSAWNRKKKNSKKRPPLASQISAP